jgi:hypothetical protein
MTERYAYQIAMAAGQDAGNRSMRKAGRTSWNEEDWNAACSVTLSCYQPTPNRRKGTMPVKVETRGKP